MKPIVGLLFVTVILSVSASGANDLDNIVSVTKILMSCAVQVQSVPPAQFATGILVKIPENRDQLFFVTNKHVFTSATKLKIMVPSLDSADNILGTLDLEIDCVDSLGRPTYTIPANQAGDIAIVAIRKDDFKVTTQSHFGSLPLLMFVKDTLIFPGQPIRFYGYPLGLTVNKYCPLVRAGVVAGIDTSQHIVYLDADAFGGSSGSPVFIDITSPVNDSFLKKTGVQKLFIGIISGYKPFIKTLVNSSTHETEMVQTENSGIAVVVPASQLETLVTQMSQKLKK